MALLFAVVLGASTVASTLTVTRGFLVAFLDHSLRGAPQEVWSDVRAPTDVLVEVYPLKAVKLSKGRRVYTDIPTARGR